MGSQEFDWHSGRLKFQTELTGTVTGGELLEIVENMVFMTEPNNYRCLNC